VLAIAAHPPAALPADLRVSGSRRAIRARLHRFARPIAPRPGRRELQQRGAL